MDYDDRRDTDPDEILSPKTDRDDEYSPKFLKSRTPWQTVSARVISLVSRKGGVGKTTSAVNLGAALALSGHSVLVVGVDPQCGVARSLGYGPDELPCSLVDVFANGSSLTHLVQNAPLDNLCFVSPKVRSLAEEENFVAQMNEHVDIFVGEIDHARNLYDTILIDCPPSLGSITRAALLASDSFLVPVQAEELCRDSLEPLLDFVTTFCDKVYAEVEDPSQSPLVLEGLFLTMVNSRTRMSKHVVAQVDLDHGTSLFETSIPRTTRLTEMALRGKPAVIYDRRSAGSRAYFNLADEIVERHCRQSDLWPTDAAERTSPTGDDGLPGNGNGSPDSADSVIVDPAVDPAPQLVRDEAPVSEFDRLLQELRRADTARDSSPPGQTENQAPEMVSLDELLAEEERGAGDGNNWDDTGWDNDADPGNRPH